MPRALGSVRGDGEADTEPSAIGGATALRVSSTDWTRPGSRPSSAVSSPRARRMMTPSSAVSSPCARWVMTPSVSLLQARSSWLMPINQPVQISINKPARQHRWASRAGACLRRCCISLPMSTCDFWSDALGDRYTAQTLMLRSILAVLAQIPGDAVLMFIGETVLLLRRGGRLYLDAGTGVWTLRRAGIQGRLRVGSGRCRRDRARRAAGGSARW